MSEAVGIHDHPTLKLGRRTPSNKPALMAAQFLTGAAVAHDSIADHFSRVQDWGLYRNDLFGICGPTSAANSRKLITAYLTGSELSPGQSAVDDLYRRSGNPGFTGDPNNPGEDNGVDMQTMCEQLVSGGLDGTKALGFAKVDVTDLGQLDAAIDTFGFLLLGVDLEDAQKQQTNQGLWDYLRSPDWGGHAILAGRYDEQRPSGARRGVITWATVVDMTVGFIEQQLQEAWAVIWPEHLSHAGFRAGFDLAAFAAAYTAITGRPFPATVPATPPTPPVTQEPDQALADMAHEFVQHHHTGINQKMAVALTHWLASKGL